MSLIYIDNNNGPRIDLYEMPEGTQCALERQLLTFTTKTYSQDKSIRKNIFCAASDTQDFG